MTTAAWPGRGGGTRMDAAAAVLLAGQLQVLADPTRLRILSFAAERLPEPTTVTALVEELRLSQSTISHHMKVLLEAGHLTLQRSGTWSLYRPVADVLAALALRIAPQLAGSAPMHELDRAVDPRPESAALIALVPEAAPGTGQAESPDPQGASQ